MQTILGSGGALGSELARALKTHSGEIRLVSRNPRAVNPDDQLLAGDLTRADDVLEAVKGSEVAYLTVGLLYDTKVWQMTWPALMRNVIDACKTHGAKLVFVDNMYAYDPGYLSRMTEDTPIGPASKKGAVRAHLAGMIFDEVDKGNLQALIARGADFYGPSIRNSSLLTETVFNNLAQGKTANWVGSASCKHSFTYTPDGGKATALLGNTPDAYNQVWHLPTADNPPTGKEWIEAIAREMGVEPRYRVAGKLTVRLLGLFVPVMREMLEMLYQFDRDYVFDSGKFETRFGVKPTPYLEGIKAIVDRDYREELARRKA